MTSDETIDKLNKAEDEAKLALLNQIKNTAPNINIASALKDLATAYALTAGARLGKLPGIVDIDVKK